MPYSDVAYAFDDQSLKVVGNIKLCKHPTMFSFSRSLFLFKVSYLLY